MIEAELQFDRPVRITHFYMRCPPSYSNIKKGVCSPLIVGKYLNIKRVEKLVYLPVNQWFKVEFQKLPITNLVLPNEFHYDDFTVLYDLYEENDRRGTNSY
jgi:hypothetical protein